MAPGIMPSASQSTSLPAFLQQSKSDIHAKFIDLEWQQRNRLLQGSQPVNPADPPSQWSRLTGDAVISRNRYMNVEPFAGNRIKLNVSEGENDYINASPIQLGKRKYIATQGPKDTSVNHFYRMLASEVRSPAVVVMLTQTHEAGKEKCFQYYPLSPEESPMTIPEDEEAQDGWKGELHLEAVTEDNKSRSQLRRMRLRTTTADGREMEIELRHLLFGGWPDFLIPEGEDRLALVELVRLSATLNQPHQTAKTNGHSSLAHDLTSPDQDNPRVIHCSAGVGRSGTFIALDYLLSMLYSDQLDDLPADRDPIAETVDLLRQQRMMMVQGESQFNFLYEVMREQMLLRAQGGDAVGGAQETLKK